MRAIKDAYSVTVTMCIESKEVIVFPMFPRNNRNYRLLLSHNWVFQTVKVDLDSK